MLRFPGDWVGPLDELVPFGPSADRESLSDAPDFWGEGSAVLQDAVEVADVVGAPERARHRDPSRFRNALLAAGGVLAAALFAVAGVLDGSPSSEPRVHAVPFAVASIPPLAAAPEAIKRRPARHRAVSHPQRHPKATRSTTASTRTVATASPVTTPSPTYHPAPASSSSTGTSSQSGGAFTLGGP